MIYAGIHVHACVSVRTHAHAHPHSGDTFDQARDLAYSKKQWHEEIVSWDGITEDGTITAEVGGHLLATAGKVTWAKDYLRKWSRRFLAKKLRNKLLESCPTILYKMESKS